MKQKLFTILAVIAFPCLLFSNNLLVENITLTGQNTTDDYTMVQFDISWDNSWRDIINSDAVWVFVKYKGSSGFWQPARLDLTNSNHTAPSGSVISAANYGDSYAPGVFMYRDANGAGSIDWDNVQLRWNYGENGVADDDLVTVKVFAIEMVYIPWGSFDLGDASGGSTTNHFYHAGTGDTDPFWVTAQGAITTSSSGSGNLWASGEIDGGTSNADFPTGYEHFYCMKYEITQEQYMDFLNTLTRAQQNTRTATDISGTSITNRYVMSNTSTISNRNGIRCDATLPASGPITIYCDYDGDGVRNETGDGQNIACNFLTWMDGCAYADWAGLRPMTELEYEKACRGDQAAAANEYAWGNNNIHGSSYTLTDEGAFNEVISGQPSSTGNASYSTTDGSIDGPLRAGIFALSSTNRQESGASYYGVMELSGNIVERTVTIGNFTGRNFTGSHGNGILSTNGNANNSSWPGLSLGEVTGATGSGIRGGAWGYAAALMHVSDRIWGATGFTGRNEYYGFRCVHTVP
jgi:formylglycine-generating enzyme required for sulfatase activity